MKTYIAEQVELLMKAEDAESVPFFTQRKLDAPDGFDWAGTSAIGEADDSDSPLLQMVLAVLDGNNDLASNLAERFREPLRITAEKLITKATERRLEEQAEDAA